MVAPQPGIGDWYRQKEGGALFEVVAFDDDDHVVAVAVRDGIEELTGFDVSDLGSGGGGFRGLFGLSEGEGGEE